MRGISHKVDEIQYSISLLYPEIHVLVRKQPIEIGIIDCLTFHYKELNRHRNKT
jgi:hypothetical protein